MYVKKKKIIFLIFFYYKLFQIDKKVTLLFLIQELKPLLKKKIRRE